MSTQNSAYVLMMSDAHKEVRDTTRYHVALAKRLTEFGKLLEQPTPRESERVAYLLVKEIADTGYYAEGDVHTDLNDLLAKKNAAKYDAPFVNWLRDTTRDIRDEVFNVLLLACDYMTSTETILAQIRALGDVVACNESSCSVDAWYKFMCTLDRHPFLLQAPSTLVAQQ